MNNSIVKALIDLCGGIDSANVVVYFGQVVTVPVGYNYLVLGMDGIYALTDKPVWDDNIQDYMVGIGKVQNVKPYVKSHQFDADTKKLSLAQIDGNSITMIG